MSKRAVTAKLGCHAQLIMLVLMIIAASGCKTAPPPKSTRVAPPGWLNDVCTPLMSFKDRVIVFPVESWLSRKLGTAHAKDVAAEMERLHKYSEPNSRFNIAYQQYEKQLKALQNKEAYLTWAERTMLFRLQTALYGDAADILKGACKNGKACEGVESDIEAIASTRWETWKSDESSSLDLQKTGLCTAVERLFSATGPPPAK